MSQGSIWIPLNSVFIFLVLLLYVILGSFMEHKKVKFGHETGVALIAGLIISASIHYFAGKEYDIPFDGTLFFYVCLPPIIFAAGFNMRQKRFFANLGYILFFGVLGTIVVFFAFAGMTYGAMRLNFIQMYEQSTQTWVPLELSFLECLVLGALLCSSDAIAAVSIVKYEE